MTPKDRADLRQYVRTPDFMKSLYGRRVEDAPLKPVLRMSAKMYLLNSLAWDYADTCCDIAASMRVEQLKPLCRAVRQLKREYDRFRNWFMLDECVAKEAQLGLMFEDLCKGHLAKLNTGLCNDKAVARATSRK